MPLLRYFTFVGGALLALLVVVSFFLPEPETITRPDAARPVIRIASDGVAPFPHPFRKFRSKCRRASRMANLVHRCQPPYCLRGSSARKRESQSGPIAKEWPPILRGFRLSIQLGKF
jgi:hypothetical protein